MDDFVNPDKSGDADSVDARNGIEDSALVRFTAFVSNRRLSKHYKRKPDGDLETLSGTQFSSGGYYVCEIPAAGVIGRSILATVGQVIDELSSTQAIGLGVPLNGTITGTIVTKAQHAKANITAIPRSLDYFGWPGLGQLLIESILQRDFYLAVDAVVLAAGFLICGNLLADVLLYWADPRIRAT